MNREQKYSNIRAVGSLSFKPHMFMPQIFFYLLLAFSEEENVLIFKVQLKWLCLFFLFWLFETGFLHVCTPGSPRIRSLDQPGQELRDLPASAEIEGMCHCAWLIMVYLMSKEMISYHEICRDLLLALISSL